MINKKGVHIFFIQPHYTVYYYSESGKVKITSNSSLKKGGKISQYTNPFGYLTVKIGNRHRFIHQIVTEHFLGGVPKGLTVNHIDGNKLNNSIENLEYMTRAENIAHAISIGLHVSTHPEDMGSYIDGRSMGANRAKYKSDWQKMNNLKKKIEKELQTQNSVL